MGTSAVAEREQMEFDALVVGAGPAGLAAAIRLKQLAPESSVCVVEKGSEVGAHILSGAVIEPRALDELLPDWRDDMPALTTPASTDNFMLLTEKRAFKLPTPPQMHNEGNYVVCLGNVCRWLGAKAEALGVEIYPGFAASETIIEDGQVRGVVAGVAGIDQARRARPELRARHGAARRLHLVRGRLPRLADQAAGERVRPAPGRRAADLRAGHQGIVGDPAREAHAGADLAFRGLAAAVGHLRRFVALHAGREPRLHRLRGRTRLSEPLAVARSTSSSASRPTRRCAASSRAASASPTGRGP